jgi:ADP-ribose pyrophosphatase
MPGPWRRVASTRLQHCAVFDVHRVHFEPPGGGEPRPFYQIEAPDWVNVIALTAASEVLLLRQYRFGVDQVTLEIPGGMCDPGETPAEAARRELREETGYAAGELIELGWVHPNPALQTNRCHSFLARDVVQVGPPAPDEHEDLELVTLPLAEIPRRIAAGEITHALVVAAFQLLGAAGQP